MGEFRIGRSRAQHSYPDTPRAGVAAFARNSAFGPQGGTQGLPAIGDKVKWTALEVGTVGGTVVPITPHVTGIVRVIVTVECQNTNTAAGNTMAVNLLVDGASVGVTTGSPINAAIVEGQLGIIAIPLTVVFAGANKLSVGVAHTLEVQVTPLQGGTATAVIGFTSIDVQELPTAT